MMRLVFRSIVLGVCTLMICCTMSCGLRPDTPDEPSPKLVPVIAKTEFENAINDIEKLTKEQRQALEATHYCLEIASLLNKNIYPDKRLDKFNLELQYRKIVDEDYKFLNLQKETVALLIDVVGRIKDLRIETGDRELLNDLYEKEKKMALFRCLPANMAVLVSADWRQIVANAAQTLLFSAFNYVKIRYEIELNHKKESWELDKKDIENETKYFQKKIQTLFEICESNRVNPVNENDMTELIKRFNVIDLETDDDCIRKPINDLRKWLDESVIAKRYKNYSTYWYYRGKLACIMYRKDKKEQDFMEAQGCFKVYQKLAEHTIIEYNPVAIEVAERQIYLQLEQKNIDRKFIFEQLAIIRKNLSGKSLDRQSVRIFCGEIYYLVLGDYNNAAEMFKNAEESSINEKHRKCIDEFCNYIEKGDYIEEFKGNNKQEKQVFYDKWEKCHKDKVYTIGDFAAKDNDDVLHFLPKLDVEFFARMAYYRSLHKARKDYSLVDEIAKNEANWPYISPWEFLFYAAHVKMAPTKKKYYEEILPRVLLNKNKYDCSKYFKSFPDWKLKKVGERPLPYELKYLQYKSPYFFGSDTYSLKMPYLFALLSDMSFSMNLIRKGVVVKRVRCDGEFIEKNKSNQVFLRLDFPIDQEELIKENIDGIRFDFKYRYFDASLSFDLGGKLTEKKDKNFYENLSGYISFRSMDTEEMEKAAEHDSGNRNLNENIKK